MQMYKIYINHNILILTNNRNVSNINRTNYTFWEYDGNKKSLLKVVKGILKGEIKNNQIIFYENLEFLMHDFSSHFKVITAGGGLVLNPQNNILFIYRNNCWDLPKGKAEKGESIMQTAHREVIEETGVKGLTVNNPLCKSFHVYFTQKGKMVLKQTFWYVMNCTENTFELQSEEGIENAKWLSVASFLESCKPVYRNIREVCETYLVYYNRFHEK